MNQRFYKRHEEMELRFYQLPKALFGNRIYKGLSLGAKAMYSILRDRQDLSIQNDWCDEEGNIFSIYSVEELAEVIEMDRKAVMRYKQELVKYGLLIDRRMGQGKPNKLYVLKPENTHNEQKTFDNIQKSQKGTSRSTNKGLQEVPKWDTNDTDVNDTNLINDDDDITPMQTLFVQLLAKYKISKELADHLCKELPRSLDEYEAEALERTFKKTFIRVRNKGINNIARWFASTLENETFTMEQVHINKMETNIRNARYGIKG